MAETAVVEHKPLTKRVALEYLERQGKPVTAKELGIDSDSRASTASELLERMTVQSLLSRNERERPRSYSLTEAGRERLAFFRSQDNGEQLLLPSNPGRPAEGGSASDPNPAPEDNGGGESEEFGAFREEIRSQFQALREDVENIFEALGIRPARGEASLSPVEQIQSLRRRLEVVAEQAKEKLDAEAVADLYQARHVLARLCWYDSKEVVKKRIGDLEAALGVESAKKIARLVDLELELDVVEQLEEVLRLRQELRLPADVVGAGEVASEDDDTDAFGFAKRSAQPIRKHPEEEQEYEI